MNAKWLLILVLTCGAALAFWSTGEAADICPVDVRGAVMTAVDLAGGDWRREFALDRAQAPTTIRAQSQAVYHWVKSRAELGDANAQWVVAEGIISNRGHGCGIRDWSEIEAWLRRSADQGYAPARLQLAHLFWARPIGLESPESKGIEMFGRADAQDDPVSEVYLGLSHECGRGFPKNLVEARRYFASAEARTRLASDRTVALLYFASAEFGKRLARDRTVALLRDSAVRGLKRVEQSSGVAQPSVVCDSWF
jgi:TPR repeat protein